MQNKSKKCIFIHNPKTAGCYIQEVLRKNGITFKTFKHNNVKAVKKIIGKDEWNSSFKFVFVRNPWDKIVSWYYFHVNNRPHSFKSVKKMKFIDFVDLICGDNYKRINRIVMENKEFWKDIIDNGMKNPLEQIQYTEDVDFIGKFENLHSDLKKILNILRKDYIIEDKINFSKHPNYIECYNNYTKEKVRKRYIKDIRHFNYDFLNSKINFEKVNDMNFDSNQSKNELSSNLISGKTILTIGFNNEFIKDLNKNKFKAENTDNLDKIKNINKQFDTLILNKDIDVNEKIINNAINLLKNGGRIILALLDNKKAELIDNIISKNKNYIFKTDYSTSDNYLVKTFFVKKEDNQTIQNKPAVDILMPTYNEYKHIYRAINSVVNQTYKNWKLYIVNDGGGDIADIIKKFNDKRIIYIKEKHKGKSHALNVGIKKSNNEYIAYLDDDDIWYPCHLEYCMNTILRKNKDFVFSGNSNVNLNNNIETQRNILNQGLLTDKLLWSISHISVVHRRSLLDKTGKYDENRTFFIDWDIFVKMARFTKPYHLKTITGEHYCYYANNVMLNKISSIHKKNPRLSQEKFKEMIKNAYSIINKNDFFDIINNNLLEKGKNKNLKTNFKNLNNEIKNKENEIKSKDSLIANQNKTLEAFGRLNNTLLGRINWAVYNPKKFLKKYFEKTTWAIRNPKKFLIKYLFCAMQKK